MAGAFNDEQYHNQYVQSLKNALSGVAADYSVMPGELNRPGKCEGRLVGGNLALVAHLVGSASSYNTKSKILFLEDVGEYLYNIDRMLIQLKRAGMFDKLAGLVFGGFTDLKDTTTPFGAGIKEILQHHVAEYEYPVCYDFPVSHEKENYALKVGVKHKLTVTNESIHLTEMV
jgi:muramoyltetrapeptide carboxypeptidase